MRDDCTGIEGVEAEEAEALIAALAEHIVKPAFVYRHQWRRGDLLMWDNCSVQHRAIQDYDLPQRRLMHRTTMGGTVPIYMAGEAILGEVAHHRHPLRDGTARPMRSVLDHIGQPSADQNGQSLFHDLPTVTLVTRIGV